MERQEICLGGEGRMRYVALVESLDKPVSQHS